MLSYDDTAYGKGLLLQSLGRPGWALHMMQAQPQIVGKFLVYNSQKCWRDVSNSLNSIQDVMIDLWSKQTPSIPRKQQSIILCSETMVPS